MPRSIGGWENLEHLTLSGDARIGEGNELANQITGNDQDNELQGHGGNDRLDGGKGNDLLMGGDGADTYVLNRHAGIDTIEDDYASSTIAVSSKIAVEDIIVHTAEENGVQTAQLRLLDANGRTGTGV